MPHNSYTLYLSLIVVHGENKHLRGLKIHHLSHQRVSTAPVRAHVLSPNNALQRLRQRLGIISPSLALPVLGPIQPHRVDPQLRKHPLVHRRARGALNVNDVRHVLRILVSARPGQASRIGAGVCNGGHKVVAGEGVARGAGFTIRGAVEDQDLVSDVRAGDGLAHALEDQVGDERGEERADAVDDGVCAADGLEHARVCRDADLLAVGVDVPDAGDARRQVFLVLLGEGDGGPAQRGQAAGEICVLNGVVLVQVVVRRERRRDDPRARAGTRQRHRGRWRAGMRNVVLARDDGAVGQARGNVVRKVGVERRQDGHPVGHRADGAQQVNGGLEAAREEPRAGEEQVADAGAGKVEAAAGPHALDDFQVEAVEE